MLRVVEGHSIAIKCAVCRKPITQISAHFYRYANNQIFYLCNNCQKQIDKDMEKCKTQK